MPDLPSAQKSSEQLPAATFPLPPPRLFASAARVKSPGQVTKPLGEQNQQRSNWSSSSNASKDHVCGPATEELPSAVMLILDQVSGLLKGVGDQHLRIMELNQSLVAENSTLRLKCSGNGQFDNLPLTTYDCDGTLAESELAEGRPNAYPVIPLINMALLQDMPKEASTCTSLLAQPSKEDSPKCWEDCELVNDAAESYSQDSESDELAVGQNGSAPTSTPSKPSVTVADDCDVVEVPQDDDVVKPRAEASMTELFEPLVDGANEIAKQMRKQFEKDKRQMVQENAKSALVTVDPGQTSSKRCSRVIAHPFFSSLCSLMILFNSILIGISTEWLTHNADEASWMIFAGHFCSLFFLIECIMRLYVLRRVFFTGDDYVWNIFDFILVLFSIIDTFMGMINPGSGSSVGSAMKTVKMLRIVRIFRVFRFFAELTVLALMITESLKSLMWALIMLALIMYVFAICFVTGATEFLNGHCGKQGDTTCSAIYLHFGSIGRASNTLTQSMLGGVSWGEVSGPLESVGWALTALFLFYIFFTMFAVLNIITGVFVDNAVQTANNQREFLVEKEMEIKEKYLFEMRSMFDKIDHDQDGSLTAEDLKLYLADARINSYFQVLGMDPNDSERLFKLLDEDGSGLVGRQEFLDGCLRLKGGARSVDVHSIMYDCKHILQTVRQLTEHFKIPPKKKKGNFRLLASVAHTHVQPEESAE